MNQYILHALTNFSADEERLKILRHTPYLFQNFHQLLTPIKSVGEGGFFFFKYWSWSWPWPCPKPRQSSCLGLYEACKRGDITLALLMILRRANNWNVGLSGACEGGHLDLVNLMIEKGAHHWDWGLGGACDGGHPDLIKLMIQKGATSCKCFKTHFFPEKSNCKKGLSSTRGSLRSRFWRALKQYK